MRNMACHLRPRLRGTMQPPLYFLCQKKLQGQLRFKVGQMDSIFLGEIRHGFVRIGRIFFVASFVDNLSQL